MALGKNLENLLGDYFGTESITLTGSNDSSESIMDIELSDIDSNPFQTRKYFAPQKIESLAHSIETSGLLNPITVLREHSTGRYTLLAGERRLRAFKHLKRKTIPATIKDAQDLTQDDKFIISSSENLQRENLSAIELAQTFEILVGKVGSVDALAATLGTSDQYIRNYLNLLKLSPQVIKALTEKQIGEGQARQLVGFEHVKQNALLALIIKRSLSVRQIIALLKQQDKTGKKTITWAHSLSTDKMKQVQSFIKQFPNSDLKIKGNDTKGQIVIKWG